MTRPPFEYDDRTDEPRPPLRNATPLLLVMAVGGALLLALLAAGGLVALLLARRTADPATGQVTDATRVACRDGPAAGDRPSGCGPDPFRPDHRGRPGAAEVARGPGVGACL